MRVYYDRDADLNLIKARRWSSSLWQPGHAHALNLRDSGVKDVAVRLRQGLRRRRQGGGREAQGDGGGRGAKWADVMMMLTPDELQGEIWRDHLSPKHEAGRGAHVRAWPQHPFQPDRAAPRSRRD